MLDPMLRWLNPLRAPEGDGGGKGADTLQATDTVQGGNGADTVEGGNGGKPAGGGTVLDDTVDGGGGGTKPQDWPDDWREKYAGTDDKKLGLLKRFGSPAAALDALVAAQQKIRSGEIAKPAPGKDAKPEEVAAWRKDNGIPEKPEGYFEKLPDGLVIGEADKPGFDKLASALHEVNAPPAVAHAVAQVYGQIVEDQQAQRAEQDRQAKAATEDALRAEWGGEYRANLNAVKGFIDAVIPADRRDAFMNARLGDGTALFNDDRIVRALLAQARETNPMVTVVPAGTGDAAQAIETELDGLKKLMANRNSEYWKGPTAEKKQARFRELVEAQQRAGKRAA